jgi:hypothetical protein
MKTRLAQRPKTIIKATVVSKMKKVKPSATLPSTTSTLKRKNHSEDESDQLSSKRVRLTPHNASYEDKPQKNKFDEVFEKCYKLGEVWSLDHREPPVQFDLSTFDLSLFDHLPINSIQVQEHVQDQPVPGQALQNVWSDLDNDTQAEPTASTSMADSSDPMLHLMDPIAHPVQDDQPTSGQDDLEEITTAIDENDPVADVNDLPNATWTVETDMHILSPKWKESRYVREVPDLQYNIQIKKLCQLQLAKHTLDTRVLLAIIHSHPAYTDKTINSNHLKKNRPTNGTPFTCGTQINYDATYRDVEIEAIGTVKGAIVKLSNENVLNLTFHINSTNTESK